MYTATQRLRTKIANIQKATIAGTQSFATFAKLHESKIYKCRYNELEGIFCDTMAVKEGKTIITEQNLQYYPDKVRYFFVKNNH